MKITDKTLFAEIDGLLNCISEDKFRELKQKAPLFVVPQSFYGLTIAQFNAGCKGDVTSFIPRYGTRKMTAFDYFTRLAFIEFVDTFIKQTEQYKVPQDSKEQQAMAACVNVSGLEAMLVFARSYFQLASFEQAERITLGEFLIARRDAYNTAIYQRKYMQLNSKKR